MKLKKPILLFLALLFPACIFLFLKYFGKNEFAVSPLYVSNYPNNMKDCGVSVTLPYRISDSIKSSLLHPSEKLTLLLFGEANDNTEKQLKRVMGEYGNDLILKYLANTPENLQLKKCVFFMNDSWDLVLVDGTGLIRGEYRAADREEIDRLLTELTIILKRF